MCRTPGTTDGNGAGSGSFDVTASMSARYAQRSRPSAGEDADDARAADADADIESKRLQPRGHDAGRARFAARQLRMPMEIAADLDECRLVRLHVRGDALVNGRARLASDGDASDEGECKGKGQETGPHEVSGT